MNWLSEFLLGAWWDDEGAGAALTFKRFMKRAAALGKKWFRKIRRRPWPIAIVIALLIAAPFCYSKLRASAKSLFPSSPLFPSTAAPSLPVFDEEVLSTDPAAVERHWRYIVIHHSASTRGSAQIFDQAHRERGWRSLGYHFVIGNGTDQGDGIVAPGPRWYSQEAGAHAHSAEHNEYGIGVCLVGNFDVGKPSAAQWATLVTLAQRLSRRYGIPPANIVGHGMIRQGGSTACPGKFFPMIELREAVGR